MRWAIKLDGHLFDLADWKAFLQAPSDPYVEIIDLPGGGHDYLLRSQSFEHCTTTAGVREIAIPLVRRLNALAAVHNSTGALKFDTIVEILPDGTIRRHVSMQVQAGMLRFHGSGVAVAIGGPPPQPQQSFVQKALAMATGDLLGALEHFERANNWHDLYKAFEALTRHVGRRDKLKMLGATQRDIDDFAMSAQIARHHKPSGIPLRVFTLAEGRDFVRRLIRACFP